MNNKMGLTSEEFYENCLDIFGSVARLRIIKNQLNNYFSESKFFVYKDDALAVEDDDSAIRFESFHELEEYLKEQIIQQKFMNETEAEVELNKLVHSLISLHVRNINAPSWVMPKICDIYKKETKVLLRIERVNALGEELIQKYGEEVIIEAEKYFEEIGIYFPDDNSPSGKELLYFMLKEWDGFNPELIRGDYEHFDKQSETYIFIDEFCTDLEQGKIIDFELFLQQQRNNEKNEIMSVNIGGLKGFILDLPRK